MLVDVTNSITDWLFPRRCAVCQADIIQTEICDICSSLCHPCPNPLFTDENTASLFYFELTIKQLIKRAKFYNDQPSLHVLMHLVMLEIKRGGLATRIKELAPDAVTFIPSHWLRRAVRGIELPLVFAYACAKEMRLPVHYLLDRPKFFDSQTARSSRTKRIIEVRGSLELRSTKKNFSRLLLIDDVITTGATINEAKRCLRKISDRVISLTIAKTP